MQSRINGEMRLGTLRQHLPLTAARFRVYDGANDDVPSMTVAFLLVAVWIELEFADVVESRHNNVESIVDGTGCGVEDAYII